MNPNVGKLVGMINTGRPIAGMTNKGELAPKKLGFAPPGRDPKDTKGAKVAKLPPQMKGKK